MQTAWNGLGLPADNMIDTDVFVAKSFWKTLDATPGVVHTIALPAGTNAVKLWTADGMVWYALDDEPGPIPVSVPDAIVGTAAFRLGDVLVPNTRQLVALPLDGMAHTLFLVSQAGNAVVLITVLMEIS